MRLRKFCFLLIFSLMEDSIISAKIDETLMKRYNSDVTKCYSSKKQETPGYECSGLVIRGIRNGKGGLKYAWSLKRLYKKKGAFSFAFLRRDQFFTRFPRDYEAGFILYPLSDIPRKKSSYKVYCAFPLDANTDARAGHGCGEHLPDRSESSKHCDVLHVTSLKKWIEQHNKLLISGDLVGKQCAFDMTLTTAARDFEIMAKANAHIQNHSSKYFLRNNELRIQAWDETKPHKLPIQAFFYLTTSSGGLAAAKLYRDEYRQLTQEDVPIVGIKLPTTREGKILIMQSDPCGIPINNKKIIVHNMRNFDVYGSNHGAWIRNHGQSDNACHAQQIQGIDGHVIDGIITDTFFKQIYVILLTKIIGNNHREYYAMKDGVIEANKIQGLPNDASLLAIHNLGGVNYFGSMSGAFKHVQGNLYVSKVTGVNGPVRRVVLGGSSNPDDARFYPNK